MFLTPDLSSRRTFARLGGVAVLALMTGCAGAARRPAPRRPRADWAAVDARADTQPQVWRHRREQVVMQAMTAMQTPYRWGGSTLRQGFDCSGLVVWAYQRGAGLILPRTSATMAEGGRPVRTEHLAPGDLVFFNTSGRRFSHVGLYVSAGRFIHAPSTGKDVRLEQIDHVWWSPRFDGIRRYIG